MSDKEIISEQSESSARGFFGKLANGDFGLAKTYWLYGVLVGILVNLVSRVITSTSVLLLLVVAYTVYEIPVLIGTWRAANNYQGLTAWAVLAKIAVVLGVIVLAMSLIGALALLRQS